MAGAATRASSQVPIVNRCASFKRGRPALVVPPNVRLTQTIKHRDEHGKLASVDIRAALGEVLSEPGTFQVQPVNRTLPDRVPAPTRHSTWLCETGCHM